MTNNSPIFIDENGIGIIIHLKDPIAVNSQGSYIDITYDVSGMPAYDFQMYIDGIWKEDE